MPVFVCMHFADGGVGTALTVLTTNWKFQKDVSIYFRERKHRSGGMGSEGGKGREEADNLLSRESHSGPGDQDQSWNQEPKLKVRCLAN